MVPIARRAKHRSLFLLILAFLLGLPVALLSPAVALADLAVGGKAVVITTEGDRLTVRSGPGRQFPTIGSLAEGTQVTLIEGPQSSADGVVWFKVQGGGLTGWCSAEWLGEPGAAPPPAASTAPAAPAAPPATTPPPASTPDPGSAVNGGSTPRITGTGGFGARLRAEPSLKAAIVLVIPEGATVELTGATRTAEGYQWVQVLYTGATGWVASSLLTANIAVPSSTPKPSAAPAPAPAPTPAPTPVPAAAPAPTTPGAGNVAVGNSAVVVDTEGYVLRIRSRPGLDAPIVGFIPPAGVVKVTAGPQADSTGAPWFSIEYSGMVGWVLAEHLAPTNAPLSAPAAAPPAAPAPSAAPTPAPKASAQPTPPPSSAPVATPKPSVAPAPASADRGRKVVDTAMRYLGVPYVYGGATPAGWDCSGFVLYVYNEAAGIALPRSAAQQYRVGSEVPANQVQAGDIVFFADTFGPGITHNGIATGDGRFIHARSEGYGTVISSLADSYWAQHYAGARRP